MKIGLNATCFNNRPSGAKQRFIGIYSNLFTRLKDDKFVIYEPVDCNISAWFGEFNNVTYIKTPLNSQHRYKKYLHGLLYWPRIFRLEKFDIFETFSLPLIRSKTKLALLTIHDIRGIHQQDLWLKRFFHNMILKNSLKHADHVITVSNYMKNETLNHFPNTKVTVIYNGINTCEFVEETELRVDSVINKFKLSSEFILAVGHLEPRKNYHLLIKALKNLHSKGEFLHLLIIGNNSGELDSITQMVESLGLSEYVKILNGITDQELKVIYKLAKLFVFPSSYEGFGIPILEAMGSDCPLVVSDIPVFREIIGNKGVYFDYSDFESIANTIKDILASNNRRMDLIEYGTKRVKDFEFIEISKNLQKLYKEVC